jgi:hypothetical protein
MSPLKLYFEISFKKKIPQKEPPICKILPPKIKQKILLTKGWGRVIQLFNSKISPNYVSFISTKVKCIVILF